MIVISDHFSPRAVAKIENKSEDFDLPNPNREMIFDIRSYLMLLD